MALVTVAGAIAAGESAVMPTTTAASTTRAEVGPRWSELTPAQRGLLGPIEHEWPRMDERNKQKWLGVAVRLMAVGPAERERIQARMTEWASLTPAQRGEMRLRYQEARQESPKSRQDRWAAYQALPPEERQKLAARGLRAPHPASAASGGGRWRTRAADASIVTRQSVAPALVQAQPGATTSLLSRGTSPPLHLQPGMPRLLASPERVDSVTLLPKRAASRPASHPTSAPSVVLPVHD